MDCDKSSMKCIVLLRVMFCRISHQVRARYGNFRVLYQNNSKETLYWLISHNPIEWCTVRCWCTDAGTVRTLWWYMLGSLWLRRKLHCGSTTWKMVVMCGAESVDDGIVIGLMDSSWTVGWTPFLLTGLDVYVLVLFYEMIEWNMVTNNSLSVVAWIRGWVAHFYSKPVFWPNYHIMTNKDAC